MNIYPVLTLRRRRAMAGFNMIEVTLAVAVVALGLVAIIGLLPVGIDASRRVADDTLVSSLVSDLMSWRRITPADKPTWFPYPSPTLNDPRPTNAVVYLDAMGNLPETEYGTTNRNYSGKFFRFDYTLLDHPDFPGSKDVARLLIVVNSPVHPQTGADLPATVRRYYVTTIARTE